jgi:hypothetical protein
MINEKLEKILNLQTELKTQFEDLKIDIFGDGKHKNGIYGDLKIVKDTVNKHNFFFWFGGIIIGIFGWIVSVFK